MAESIRIAVSGAGGRMGRAIERLVRASPKFAYAGGIGHGDDCVAAVDAAPVIAASDVVIDVSSPELLRTLIDAHAAGMNGLVVGTTGLGPAEHDRLNALAVTSPVLVAANFSLGIALLLEMVERAARVLSADGFDAEIIEAHHRAKVDAPSGTALALGEALARGRDRDFEEVRRDGRSGRPGARPSGEIGMHALRGGSVVGEHRVLFLGDRERLELAHSASDRVVFADGALEAARWLVGRSPGRYGMNDVIST